MSTELSSLRLERGGDTLLVLLPGAYMAPGDFVDHGFFAAVDRRAPGLDLALVGLGLDGISSGAAIPALLEQILRPARNDYARVWLGGISLGGLLALCLLADHPGSVDGLCLLAPYPGCRLTTNAIAEAGGLAAWQASTEQLADPEFRAWRWLQQAPASFPAFVGYGSDDRFAAGMRAIAECFPATSRRAVPGGHEWPVWRLLWEHFLDSGLLRI